VSANAATAPSGVRAADPSPGAVVHVVEAANAPSTLCAEGSSTGAASASANTVSLPPGYSSANLPTGTTFVSAGVEAGPSVAGAVSTDAALAPTMCSCRSHRYEHCSSSSKCCPSCPVTNAAVYSKSPNVGGYTGDTGSHDA